MLARGCDWVTACSGSGRAAGKFVYCTQPQIQLREGRPPAEPFEVTLLHVMGVRMEKRHTGSQSWLSDR